METKKTQRSKKPLLIAISCLIAAAIILGVVLVLTQCDNGTFTPNGGALGKQLAAEGTATITLNEDVILDAPLVVNGNKTIVGTGRILLKTAQEGSWPESDKPSWGIGCATVEAEDASAMPAALQVSKDASLTIQGSITVDAEGNANGVRLESGAQLKLSETAVIKNGRYANLVIAKDAKAEIAGGEIKDGSKFNILNHGTLNVTGGLISGAKNGANIYSTGAVTQSEGTVSLSGLHNVYIAAGSFTMTGGVNTSAAKDGIVVAEGAKADISGGEISVCIHGLCNNGQANTGKLTFSECGIMNFEGAELNIKGTTVDTSEVYCLANSGGKVTAEDFTAKKCDTVAVYNFSGDMILKNLTVTGGRDGNISNAGGNMTVDGAVLDVCRDKSVVVGNGKAVLNNVKINGTSKEKYGVYVFGGELYLNDSSIENISSTAVKADPGSYVELNNVTIKDVSQNGFQTEGGRVVINNVTLKNAGSHGIYNNGGEVIVNKMQVEGIEKNAVQHKSGTTTITGMTAKTMGNHGAYVEEGVLTIKDSAFEGMMANGFYIVKGENKLVLEGVSIKDAKQQGINNDSVVEVKNVTIENVGNNGIYNKTGASITIDGLKVTNAGEHGVSNKSQMTAKNIVINGTGKGSNGVQNNGTLTLTGAKITASKNHGIYNTGKLTASDVQINGTQDNGVYNDGGEVTVSKLEISNAQGQGVNNKGTLNLKDVTIAGAGKNGVYHSKGSAKVENLTVTDTAEHGVNNAAKLELANITISKTGAGKNGLQNSGELTVTKLSITQSANHGIYNTGKLTASDVTVKTVGDNGIYNDGGEVTVTKLDVSSAKGQGVNNAGTLNLKDVTIAGAGKNGIYHSKGSAKVENLTVTDTAEHGVNNAAKLELANITISKTGAGKNGLQNSGELTVTKLSITQSANHGIYNTGKLTASDVTVKTVGDNGIYNDGGEVTVTKLDVSSAKGQGVNNAGTLNLKDVTIAGAGKNGIYHSKGSAKVENLTVTDTAEHGVSNAAQLELANITISKTGADKNGLQNSGELTVAKLKIEGSKKHGIYNNGKLTGSQIEIKDSGDNGLYNDGGEVTALKELVIEGAVNQGINNTGVFGAENVKISRTGKNGVMNKVGAITLKDLTVSLIGEHGVNNDENGTATLENVRIDGSGAGKNNLQNQATMSVKNAELSASSNHGLYNTGTLMVTGELKITGAAVNGIYNYLGIAALEQVEVVAPGEHGINNAAHMTVGNVIVTESVQNSIQNSGTMAITGSASLLDSGKHGIYNSGAFNGKNMVVTNAFDLLLSNSGEMVIDYLKLSGTAHKAVYNAGYAELYNAIIDGKQIRNPSETATGTVYEAEYLVDNNNGILDLENTLICNAFGTAVHNRGTANTNFTGVEINGAGNYGVFVEGKASIGGDGLTIRNITKNADVKNAEGIALKIQGRTTMLDHVVIENVADQNALVLDATTAVYSGVGLTIKNVSNGGAVYNKGLLYVTDLVIEDAMNGLISRYDGKAILSGTVMIKNVEQSPIRTYGADDDKNGVKYQNSVTLSPKTELTIDGCGSHAINNKGSFLAAADSKITIKNVQGTNINAINNNKGTMTLGDVLVDGMQVDITMYDTTTINTNSSNALQTSGKLELNGDLVVKNVFYKAENNKNDNANGAGVVVKSGGQITGTGSITIIGNQTAPEGYTGLFNGVFIDGAVVDIDGDVTVSNARNQGIYVANANAKLECGNITVSNTGNNGVYVNNAAGALNAAGNVEISNAGQNGLFNMGKSTIEGNVTIRDINGGHNGVRNDGSGNLTIKGDLAISGIGGTTTEKGRGNAVASNGKLTVNGDLTISGVTASGNTDNSSNNAIYGKGVITVGGDVTVTDAVAAGHGVFLDQGKLLVTGNIEINGSGSGKNGIYLANSTESKAATVTGRNVTVKNAGGNGIYNRGAYSVITVTGDIVVSGSTGGHGLSTEGTITAANITISNTTKSDMNGIEAKSGSKMTVTGSISITNSGKRGLNNAGEVKAASLTIDGFGENGIQNSGTLEITGAVIITNSTGTGHGMYNSKTVKAGSLSISNVSRNGINNAGDLTVTGAISVKNAVQGGIGNSSGKNITAGSVTIDTVAAGPGINNAGTMTVTGLTSVKNITGTAINAVNNNGTLNLADLEISNIKVIIGTNGDGNRNANVGNGIGGKGTLNLSGTANISGIFTDQKDNAIGAGIVLTEGSKIQGAGSIVITGSASTDSAYPYGINNGIMMDASKSSVALELTGDITVKDVTNVGIYLANSAEGKTATLSARNVTVTNAGSNGVYNRGAYSYFTATGIITVDQAKGHGLNNEGAVTAGAITISNVTKGGINSTGTITVTAGDVTITNAGENGIGSNGVFSAPNSNVVVNGSNNGISIRANMTAKSITVKNSKQSGVLVNEKSVTLNVTEKIEVDGFTVRGISNTQANSVVQAGSIVVKNSSGSSIDAGIKNGNASAQILVSGDVTVSNIGGTAASEVGNGITNFGIIKITGTLKVEKVTTTGATNDKANCGIWNKGGSIEAGAVIVDQVATKAGIYLNGGSLKATTVAVSNITKFVGIFMDTKATLQATDVLVQNTGSQAIQANHANTITVTNMVIVGSTNNGLRLYNNSGNPTVKIDLLVAYNCAEYGLAAAKQLTNTNLTITAMYYENCANGVHSNITSGVTAAQGIPQAVRDALAAKGITLPASN